MVPATRAVPFESLALEELEAALKYVDAFTAVEDVVGGDRVNGAALCLGYTVGTRAEGRTAIVRGTGANLEIDLRLIISLSLSLALSVF